MKKRKWKSVTTEELKELLNKHKITTIYTFESQPRNLEDYHIILSIELDNETLIYFPICKNVTIGKLS